MIDKLHQSGKDNNHMAARTKPHSRNNAAFRNKAVDLGDDLRDMAGIAVDASREGLHKLRDTAVEDYEAAKERVVGWEEAVEAYIQERPIKSILIAALAGIVFAKVWRHR